MPYIAPEVVQEAKRMDLLTYLKNYEPHELVRVSPHEFSTRTHDSLKISNGKWCWWSRGIGGRSALDYLIKVKGHSFLEAVEMIAGHSAIQTPAYVPTEKKTEKQLLLPKPCRTATNAVSYLENRGIDRDIIWFCIRSGRIYESDYRHNVVFVGTDEHGKPRYAALRGINTSFIGEANGSDKNYSFAIPAASKSSSVHLFESAIDLLSYATIQKYQGENWQEVHLVSLAGVYQPAKNAEDSKLPAALKRYLNMYPEISSVVLHLDNDHAGRAAAGAIKLVLPEVYTVEDHPPPFGKDYNDYLCMKLGIGITKREKQQHVK